MEVKASNIVKNQFDDYNFPVSYNPLPGGNTFPSWDKSQSSTPTTDDEYNDLFKTEATRRANERSQAIFQKSANPRWKGSIQLRGEQIIPGDLIQFTSAPHGIFNLLLRVQNVMHTLSKSGWFTNITVEEDEIVVSKSLG